MYADKVEQLIMDAIQEAVSKEIGKIKKALLDIDATDAAE
jgi:hypothetical protein